MRLFYILFLLVLLGPLAPAQKAGLPGKPYHLQYPFLDSVCRLDFDVFSNHIDATIQWAATHKDNALAEHLKLLKFRRILGNGDKNTIHEKTLHAIAVNAHENGYPFVEAKAIHALGEYYTVVYKKHAHAVEFYYTAYTIYSGFSPTDFPDKRVLLFELGNAYSNYGDFDNATRYFREAIAAQGHDDYYTKTINNSLGYCYRQLKKYDSATSYFNLVYSDALRSNDSSWIGIAAGNIGITYFLQGRYADAIPLLEKDISLSMATNQIQNAASSMGYLGAIQFLRHDYTTAEKTLTNALAISQSRTFWPAYSLAERLYGQLHKVYAAQNDMRRAYLYADSTLMAKDSVHAIYSALNLSKALDKAELAQQKLQAEQLDNQRKIQLLIRNSLIICILLLTTIGILFINRQRLKQKKLEAEKKNAEHELDIAIRQLVSFRDTVDEKDHLLGQVTAELERIKQNPDAQADETVLTQLENAIILTDEQWENFRTLFEKVHKNFFVNLKKKIPDLTQAEIRFLALTKLKLSSKEMASMLGISTNAIRIYRHRIRKKLGLDKEDMIDELVNNM